MERGRVFRIDCIRLSDGQDMKNINETAYTYLEILETNTIKEKEMKKKV